MTEKEKESHTEKYTTNAGIQNRLIQGFANLKEKHKDEIIYVEPDPKIYFKFNIGIKMLSPAVYSKLWKLDSKLEILPIHHSSIDKDLLLVKLHILPEHKYHTKKGEIGKFNDFFEEAIRILR